MDSPSQAPPTLDEARQRLGLGPHDRLAEYLPHWREVEARLSGMIAEAQDPGAKASYEEDLRSLREMLQIVGDAPDPRQKSNVGQLLAWAALVVILSAGGLFGYYHFTGGNGDSAANTADLNRTQISFDQALEKRRWDEASEYIEVMQASGAADSQITVAQKQLEMARLEEQGQQVGFLLGNAQSAYEAGQLSEAEGFLSEVEALDPNHEKIPELRSLIEKGQVEVRSLRLVKAIEKALKSQNMKVATSRIKRLNKLNSDHPLLPELRQKAEETVLKIREDRERSAILLAKARGLDQGTYSAEALALVEEAMRLNPSREIRELYKKMSSYGRVVRVPADQPTIAKALKASKANDRVFVSKGVYQESLIIPPGIELIGESRADTIIECPAEEGSVITVSERAGKIRIAGMTFRHKGLVNDEERFPVVVINGGEVHLEDLLVTRASGHGIAVLNGGRARINFTTISDCGWDGLSVNGEESQVILHQLVAENNLHHGVDFWEGASGQISECRFIGNGRAGLAALNAEALVTIKKTSSEENREIGFYFSEINGLVMTDCDAHRNKFGGIVIGGESQEVKLKGNRVTKNGEAGIIIESGVELLSDSGNTVSGNTGKQFWKDAVFPSQADEDSVSPPPPAPKPPTN